MSSGKFLWYCGDKSCIFHEYNPETKYVLFLTLNYSIKISISYFPQINWQTHITSPRTEHTLQGLNKYEISITFHIFLGNFRGRVNRKRMCCSHNLWTVYPEVDFCIFCWYLEHICASNVPQQFAHLQQKTQTHTHNVRGPWWHSG